MHFGTRGVPSRPHSVTPPKALITNCHATSLPPHLTRSDMGKMLKEVAQTGPGVSCARARCNRTMDLNENNICGGESVHNKTYRRNFIHCFCHVSRHAANQYMRHSPPAALRSGSLGHACAYPTYVCKETKSNTEDMCQVCITSFLTRAVWMCHQTRPTLSHPHAVPEQ